MPRPALLAVLGLLLSLSLGSVAEALSITTRFHFTDNRGPNSIGFIPAYRHVFGAVSVSPSGPPTVVTATQGSLAFELLFFPTSLSPDTYALATTGGPNGQWLIQGSRGSDVAPPGLTPSILDPEQIPLVDNLHVLPDGLTPTVVWALPDLSTFDVDMIRVRVWDDDTNDEFFQSPPLLVDATSYTIPPGVLDVGGRYIFRVNLDDFRPGNVILENRSSTFTQSPYQVPGPTGIVLMCVGVAILWRLGGLQNGRRDHREMDPSQKS